MSRLALIFLALAFAVLSFVLLFVSTFGAITLAAAWALTAGCSLARHGKRGWPALLGGPIVLAALSAYSHVLA